MTPLRRSGAGQDVPLDPTPGLLNRFLDSRQKSVDLTNPSS